MRPFLERLAEAQPLLLDGATGTELTRRGIETFLPLWSASALRTNPEVVRQIHTEYLEAGADIITTNTFCTSPNRLGGDADEARRLTRLAVQLAQEARQAVGREAWIAGSVAPLEDCYFPNLVPPYEVCLRDHAVTVEALAEGGVDFCLLETMNTLHEAAAAARAAHEVGIPFIASFITNERGNLLSDEPLQAAIEALLPYGPAAFMINCIPTRHMSEALRRLRSLTDLPIGGYGNMGTPDQVVGWAFEGEISPHDYCQHAAEWLKLGAKIIGSCCGSQPAHTAALRRLLAGIECSNHSK